MGNEIERMNHTTINFLLNYSGYVLLFMAFLLSLYQLSSDNIKNANRYKVANIILICLGSIMAFFDQYKDDIDQENEKNTSRSILSYSVKIDSANSAILTTNYRLEQDNDIMKHKIDSLNAVIHGKPSLSMHTDPIVEINSEGVYTITYAIYNGGAQQAESIVDNFGAYDYKDGNITLIGSSRKTNDGDVIPSGQVAYRWMDFGPFSDMDSFEFLVFGKIYYKDKEQKSMEPIRTVHKVVIDNGKLIVKRFDNKDYKTIKEQLRQKNIW